MGAGQSTNTQAPTSFALHILRVTPGSPASQTSIEPFFDFIVGFNGKDSVSGNTDIDAVELERIVEEHEGRVLDLLVWSGKTHETRVVSIVPSRGWSLAQQAVAPRDQSGISPPQPSLLGLSMRTCEFESAMNIVWRVLEVFDGSPAESAGLVPGGDWIIGWSDGVLTAENDFYDVVEAHVDKPLRVYVYSYDFDNLREVVLMPNRHWGGEGLLGCVFGFGHLHRLPSQPADRKPDTPLPSIQEQENWEDNQDFYPADLSPSRSSSSLDQQRQSHRSPPMAHPRPTRPNDTTSYGVSRQPTFSPSPSFRTPSIGGRPLGPTSLNGSGTASPGPYPLTTFGSLFRGSNLATTPSTPTKGVHERIGGDGDIDVSGGGDGNGTEHEDDSPLSISETMTEHGSLTSVE